MWYYTGCKEHVCSVTLSLALRHCVLSRVVAIATFLRETLCVGLASLLLLLACFLLWRQCPWSCEILCVVIAYCKLWMLHCHWCVHVCALASLSTLCARFFAIVSLSWETLCVVLASLLLLWVLHCNCCVFLLLCCFIVLWDVSCLLHCVHVCCHCFKADDVCMHCSSFTVTIEHVCCHCFIVSNHVRRCMLLLLHYKEGSTNMWMSLLLCHILIGRLVHIAQGPPWPYQICQPSLLHPRHLLKCHTHT